MQATHYKPTHTINLTHKFSGDTGALWEDITYDVALLIDQQFHADSFALVDLQEWVEEAADDLIEQGRHSATLAKLANHTAYVILDLEPYGDCE